MSSRRSAIAALACVVVLPLAAAAQSADDAPPRLSLELNALQDAGGACRLTFVARNGTGAAIDRAVYEAVIFDQSGGVVRLSLFDFRDLPAARPRVRQFDLPDQSCDGIGRVLINGANACVVGDTESDVCEGALALTSRLDVELIG